MIRPMVRKISAFLNIIMWGIMSELRAKHINISIKVLLLVFLSAVVIISQTGCSGKAAEPVSQSGYYLDTTCEITIYEMDENDANKCLTPAFDKLGEMEKILSRTVKESDVYAINHAKGEYVTVKDETIEVLKLAKEMDEISDGSFDITVGEISAKWDFTGEDPKVPDAGWIKEALTHVDVDNVQIDGNKVRLKDPACSIDLGGIAKGYIADRVTEVLQEEGVSRAIVNLGGNVVTIGEKSSGTPFVIGIERPYSDRTEIVGSVPSADQTLVTSGIYERNFTQDGKLYHHVLDPDTGYPADTDLEAVTIIADRGNSGFCDGLSTSCLIMGEKKAKALISELQKEHPDMHLEAVFINAADEVTATDGVELTLSEEK